jgi:hypothetical protein
MDYVIETLNRQSMAENEVLQVHSVWRDFRAYRPRSRVYCDQAGCLFGEASEGNRAFSFADFGSTGAGTFLGSYFVNCASLIYRLHRFHWLHGLHRFHRLHSRDVLIRFFKREFLRNLKAPIEDAYDLLEQFKSLWEYAAGRIAGGDDRYRAQ